MMSTRERDALENAYLVNEQDLRQSGHLFAVEDPQSSRTAITVRVVNGKVSITDGPFAETQGQLIGLFFIHARDLNEAIQVASKMPQARGGPIKTPTLIVVGDADSVRTSRAVEFFELLGGGQADAGWDGSGMSNAQLAILPATTHYNIFSSPTLASTVTPFLDTPLVTD